MSLAQIEEHVRSVELVKVCFGSWDFKCRDSSCSLAGRTHPLCFPEPFIAFVRGPMHLTGDPRDLFFHYTLHEIRLEFLYFRL